MKDFLNIILLHKLQVGIVIFITSAIIIGLYLVSHPTIFKPKASAGALNLILLKSDKNWAKDETFGVVVELSGGVNVVSVSTGMRYDQRVLAVQSIDYSPSNSLLPTHPITQGKDLLTITTGGNNGGIIRLAAVAFENSQFKPPIDISNRTIALAQINFKVISNSRSLINDTVNNLIKTDVSFDAVDSVTKIGFADGTVSSLNGSRTGVSVPVIPSAPTACTFSVDKPTVGLTEDHHYIVTPTNVPAGATLWFGGTGSYNGPGAITEVQYAGPVAFPPSTSTWTSEAFKGNQIGPPGTYTRYAKIKYSGGETQCTPTVTIVVVGSSCTLTLNGASPTGSNPLSIPLSGGTTTFAVTSSNLSGTGPFTLHFGGTDNGSNSPLSASVGNIAASGTFSTPAYPTSAYGGGTGGTFSRYIIVANNGNTSAPVCQTNTVYMGIH